MINLPLQRKAERTVWGFMWILLGLGLGCWGLNALLENLHYFDDSKKTWILRLPDASAWTGWFLGIGVWAGLFALCALLLKLVSKAPDLLQALAAMWRPIVLTFAAAYLLFANDQGRELGLGLIGEKNDWRLFFLFLALIYFYCVTSVG